MSEVHQENSPTLNLKGVQKADLRGGMRKSKPRKLPVEESSDSRVVEPEETVNKVTLLSAEMFSIESTATTLAKQGDESKGVASTFHPHPKKKGQQQASSQQERARQKFRLDQPQSGNKIKVRLQSLKTSAKKQKNK